MIDLVNNSHRSHTLSATLDHSTRKTVTWYRGQFSSHSFQESLVKWGHASAGACVWAHTHTWQTNACTQCHQGKLRPQFLLILPNVMPFSPQAFPTAAQHLPFFFPAAHGLYHPHPFLHCPEWTGNLCFLSTLPCLCGNPGDAVVQRMMQV